MFDLLAKDGSKLSERVELTNQRWVMRTAMALAEEEEKERHVSGSILGHKATEKERAKVHKELLHNCPSRVSNATLLLPYAGQATGDQRAWRSLSLSEAQA